MLDPLLHHAYLLFEPTQYFVDAQKRVFWLYLLSSGLIALTLLFIKRNNVWGAIRTGFSPKIWLCRSSILDIQWTCVNHLLRIALVVPILGGQISVALAVNGFFFAQFGEGNFFAPSVWQTSLIFTIAIFVTEDFSRFFVHYLYHKIPFLWRFHAVHHSAEVLTPITLYRIHFIEMFFNSCRSLLVIGCVSGVFMYLFDGRIELTTILGASIFNMMFNLAGANLRHSHIWCGFGVFERWLISPAQHQIHHSSARAHLDKNFGASLAIWDRLFGSWLASKNEQVEAFGLYKQPVRHTLLAQAWGVPPLDQDTTSATR